MPHVLVSCTVKIRFGRPAIRKSVIGCKQTGGLVIWCHSFQVVIEIAVSSQRMVPVGGCFYQSTSAKTITVGIHQTALSRICGIVPDTFTVIFTYIFTMLRIDLSKTIGPV